MVTKILESKIKDVGGFPVIRAIPIIGCKAVGPFVFWDYLPPTEVPPGPGMDVKPHPHIGLSTLSYLFEGRVVHRDSLGFTQEIQPGDVNWMTAGRGIVHSERSHEDDVEKRRPIHMIQSWIALPDGMEEIEPSFHHHPKATIPTIHQSGVLVRLVAGEAFDHRSPVHIYSPLYYLDVRMEPGATFHFNPLDIEPGVGTALWMISGSITVPGDDSAEFKPAREVSQEGSNDGELNPILRIFAEDAPITIQAAADKEGAHFILFGGRPVGRRIVWWNFVARTRERMQAAKESWRQMEWGSVPNDDEFIPLPEE